MVGREKALDNTRERSKLGPPRLNHVHFTSTSSTLLPSILSKPTTSSIPATVRGRRMRLRLLSEERATLVIARAESAEEMDDGHGSHIRRATLPRATPSRLVNNVLFQLSHLPTVASGRAHLILCHFLIAHRLISSLVIAPGMPRACNKHGNKHCKQTIR